SLFGFHTALPGPPRFPYTTLFRSLAGAGLSNRQIADRLVISQATVARHIANVFAKLGISTRAELPARLAAADGAPQPPAASSCQDRKSTRLNSSHVKISYAVFCLK